MSHSIVDIYADIVRLSVNEFNTSVNAFKFKV